jgi:hypothetical protein
MPDVSRETSGIFADKSVIMIVNPDIFRESPLILSLSKDERFWHMVRQAHHERPFSGLTMSGLHQWTQ